MTFVSAGEGRFALPATDVVPSLSSSWDKNMNGDRLVSMYALASAAIQACQAAGEGDFYTLLATGLEAAEHLVIDLDDLQSLEEHLSSAIAQAANHQL